MDNITKAWQRLENGKKFNQRLDPPLYDMVDTNWEMFKGNQYVNSTASESLPKPVFNIIKRIITFFVASLTSTPSKVYFSHIARKGEEETALKILNTEFENFAERVKLQSIIRDSYKDAAISGDFAWHIYFDTDKKPLDGKYSDVEGEICMEIVDGVNIYFGNPNNKNVQEQPYILVVGRDMISDLQEEYNYHNGKDQELQGDYDNQYQAGLDSRIEIEDADGSGKATYVIMYERRTVKGEKKIFVTKSIKDVEIYKEIDTGLSIYPVVMDNWERQKNNYHGLALCTSIIPNQIFINRMFAMAMKNLMDTAFPKVIYDRNRLGGWTNQVGGAIGVENLNPNENISNLAKYMEPGTMSPQIIQMINLAWDYTKETLGASDSMLGNVNPEQASGAAISVTAKQSAIPLTGPRDNMYDALESLGNVFLDMVSAYYDIRPVAVGVEGGGKEVVMYDFNELKGIYMTTKVDVGATSPYDEMADRLTAESFFKEGAITFMDLLESYPNLFPGSDKILERLKNEQQVQETQQNAPKTPEEILSELTPEQQQEYAQMAPEQQQALMQQAMQ